MADAGAALRTPTRAGAVLGSAADVSREAWDRCFAGKAEDGRFFRAVQAVPPSDGFTLGAVAVSGETGVDVLAPSFQVNYRLDTSLQGGLRRLTNAVHALMPQLVSHQVLVLGSPFSDTLPVGFAAGLEAGERVIAFDTLMSTLEAEARKRGCALVALKSVNGISAAMHEGLLARGFNRVTSVPTVAVDLPYRDRDAYLDGLPAKTAGYLRRKARAEQSIRFEDVADVTGLECRLHELLMQSLGRSSVDYGDFENIDPAYFTHVKDAMGEDALLTLCWAEDRLVGFQLSLIGRDRIIAKQIGIAPEGRKLNLYFVNWLRLVDAAAARGITRIELGGTTYATKLMFGGRLERRWLYYKVCNGVLNRVFKPAGRFFDFERNDPELRKLAPEHLARLA